MKHPTQKFELFVGIAQSVAMSQIEQFAVYVNGHRLIMHDNTTLFCEILLAPKVMVADKKVHLYPHIGKFGHLTLESRESLGHHIVVLEPKVEHVAQHVHCRCLVLDTVKEVDQAALACTHRCECAAAKVCVRDEINHVN